VRRGRSIRFEDRDRVVPVGDPFVIRIPQVLVRVIVPVALMATVASTAHADLMDSLFGTNPTGSMTVRQGDPKQRQWRIGDFTGLRLVAREAGAPENQHPVVVPPELLRQQLALVRVQTPQGNQALFAADELGYLIEWIAQALSVAGPGDDLLLLSSSRRDEGFLKMPTAVTARLFVHGGALNLIVHDARLEFYSEYVGTRIDPKFTYGSRTAPGSAVLQSVAASSRRGDWLVLPLAFPAGGGAAAAAAPTPAAPAAPTPAAAPVVIPAPATAVAIQPAPTPAAPMAAPPVAAPAPPTAVRAPTAVAPAAAVATPAAAAAPAPRTRDAAFAEEIEQRLVTLKRLRDRGLISEEEYQQKRREVLALL
jgi:Short C-terminal domain